MISLPWVCLLLFPTVVENKIAQGISITLLIVWNIWGFYLRLFKFSTIHIQKKNKKTSFFKRSGDNLVIAIISAIVGALVGTLVTFYLSNK